MKALVWILVLAGLGAGGWWWYRSSAAGPSSADLRFRTAKVERGDVVEGVQASGTVQPRLLVQVGTQVSGVISKLNVDFNDRVKAGDVVALLDPRRLDAQIAGDEAGVAKAKADLDRVKAVAAQSEADVGRVRALRAQASREADRQKALAERRLAAPADLEAAEATRDSLKAQEAVAEAAIRSARAQVPVAEASVAQAEAQLLGDRVQREYATILSPIDGVVVSRNVDVGQTVAASLSAPTLFVIANDLKKIQVQVSVPESDTGRIHTGQTARFVVDAHPDRTFEGAVSQIRLQPTTVQNVVTYTVLVDAENPDEVLLPGMTATVTFEIARSPAGGLRVSSAALRFRPTEDLLAAPAVHGGEAPRRERGKEKSPRPATGTLYLQEGGRLRAVKVRTGVSDGALTAVEPVAEGSLSEGAEVVTSVARGGEAQVNNPFAPPRFAGGRSSGR